MEKSDYIKICHTLKIDSLIMKKDINKEKGNSDVRFIVNDNGLSYIIDGSKHLTILENIEKAGLPIRNGCRKGLCGSCKMKIIRGGDDMNQASTSIEDGYIYSCVSKLRHFAEFQSPTYTISDRLRKSEKARKARERALKYQKRVP